MVWDNIQKHIRVRNQSKDKQNNMILWANAYAVKNRIQEDLQYPQLTVHARDLPMSTYFHTSEDILTLKDRMVVLVSRILVKHVPHFTKYYRDVVQWHIKHKYSEQMKVKNETVSEISVDLFIIILKINYGITICITHH